MKTYIALLRGINVSGQKMIKMADLKVYVEELGFKDVKTYIQSGNIIFKSENTDIKHLESLVTNKIEEKYGFEVITLIKTPEEIKQAVDENPLYSKELARIYLTFLADLPLETNIEKLKSYDYSPEEYILSGKNLYFFSPSGYGKAKMSNNFFENKLKVNATTRNWKTVNKLIELSEN